MKVLIISTNREKLPFPVVPIGAAKIVGALRKSGHVVDFLDLCFSRNIRRSIRKKVMQFHPDVIGLSIRNLDNCAYVQSHAYFEGDRKIVRMIRSVSNVPIVIGGSAVSVAPGELAAYLDVDYAFAGEGERSFRAFLSASAETEPCQWNIYRMGNITRSRNRRCNQCRSIICLWPGNP